MAERRASFVKMLRDRLERMEKACSEAARARKWLFAVLLILGAVGLYGVLARPAAEQLVFHDAHGNVRAKFSSEGESSLLHFFDAEGKPEATFTAEPSGSMLVFYNSSGKPAVRIGTIGDSPTIEVIGAGGVTHATLGMASDEPFLSLGGTDGERLVEAAADTSARPQALALTEPSEPRARRDSGVHTAALRTQPNRCRSRSCLRSAPESPGYSPVEMQLAEVSRLPPGTLGR